MKCKKNAVIKGITAGAVSGIAVASAVGWTVAAMCRGNCKGLKKKASKALKTVKQYIDDLM